MPTASELLSEVMNHPLTEDMIKTSCPTCETAQTLDQATIDVVTDPMRPTYRCLKGCGPILIIGLAMDGTWPPGRGFPAGASYLIRNPRDLLVYPDHELQKRMIFPASPNALD